ncbi:MAG: 30S ribosomal protein S4e [Candidatus Aenigmarchaeota archaeon]|nr:30S ribosomal protein S4e [Candidatus Aenigmarchaeota archaeon]
MHLKRYRMPAAWKMKTKERTFAIVPQGAHPLQRSIPLAVLLRNMLGLAQTRAEADAILREGKVLVDKKVRKAGDFGVGLMDVLEIPDAKLRYRIDLAKAGLDLQETTETASKLCRVRGKTTVRGGKTQINLHDGKNILTSGAYRPGDSVLVSLPEGKILEHFPLKKGARVLITDGTKRGLRGKLLSITEKKTMTGKATVTVDVAGKTIETRKDYLFVLGKEAA